jgi:hypothetical protein
MNANDDVEHAGLHSVINSASQAVTLIELYEKAL